MRIHVYIDFWVHNHEFRWELMPSLFLNIGSRNAPWHYTIPWLCFMSDVSHEHNSLLIMGFFIYGEHSCYILWTFKTNNYKLSKIFLILTLSFEKRPSCSASNIMPTRILEDCLRPTFKTQFEYLWKSKYHRVLHLNSSWKKRKKY